MIKTKWLIYTVLVGLIPIFARLIAWFSMKLGMVNMTAPSDFIVFGLVLHISIINELEHLPSEHQFWKTINNGISVLFIVLYSVLYTIVLIGEKNQVLIDDNIISRSTKIIALTSFILSLATLHRISIIPKEGDK